MTHGFGRVPSTPDERDWQMTSYLGPATVIATSSPWADFWRWITSLFHRRPTPPAPTVARTWRDLIQLDQGETPHCVGFGWAGWGNCEPIEDHYSNADGNTVYYEAKVLDGEAGKENGSSVRSGAKAMKNRGRLDAYVFASSLAEVKAWVAARGPVVIGSDWTEDMDEPDADGFVRPTGKVVGGHCYLLLGYDPATDAFEFDNSWGTEWGKNGRFFMQADDFASLVIADRDGEACAGVELAWKEAA